MSRREQDALLALFNSFRPTKRVTTFDQLADGNVLLEVMHSIDETHFKGGPKAHTRSPSSSTSGQDNWVLRMNILKRLYRLLLSYPINTPNAPTLAVTSLPEPNFNAIARNPKSAEGSAGLVQVCRFCVAVGAVGPSNERVIAKIQALDETAMVELMKCIEGVMDTLPKGAGDDKDADFQPPSSALREERDRLIKVNEELRAQCDQMTEQVAKLSVNSDIAKAEHLEEPETVRTKDGPTEADNLRVNLARAEDGLAETEAALEKQIALVAELTKTVEELRATALEVPRLRDQVEELRQVEDRLHKSENVIEKYKKKLEESAGLRRELRSLEEENTAMVDKNSALEAELRKLGANKTLVDHYKDQIESLEKKASAQGTEFAQLTVQLEEAQAALADMESERNLLRDEIQVHQERIRELESGPPRSNIADQSLDLELISDTEETGQSKTDLKLRVRALERQLAEVQAPEASSGRIAALEQLLAEAQKKSERSQNDYLEANKQSQLAQAKLEHILTGRGGDNTQTALALRQKLDEVLAERDSLFKDKQAAEVAHEELVRQLTAAKADLALVDKDQRSVIAAAREEANSETYRLSEQVNSLKEELATRQERDRLQLEEIRRLLLDKIELQSAGLERGDQALDRERRLNDLREALAAGGTSPASQTHILELQKHNDELLAEVAALNDRLKKTKVFIKNQDTLFRTEHDKKLSSGDDEQQQGYESQITALKNQLSVAKHNALSRDSLYRLEQQLMLAAWHDVGARSVRDHVAVAGLRRPTIARPAATSWLGRQRKLQDEALFTR